MTLLQLVKKYPVGQVIAAAEKLARGVRTAGRPADYRANAIAIWAHVEYRCRYNGTGLKKDALRSLAADLRHHIADHHPAAGTIGRLYSEAVKLFATEPQMKNLAEEIIRALEQTRAANIAAGVEDLQIPLLVRGKTADGLLRTAILDTHRENGE